MDNLKDTFLNSKLADCEREINDNINVLCDVSMEIDLSDIIALFQVIKYYRNLKKFIKKCEGDN